MVQLPLFGAVQTHHTDLAGALPAWLGSPTSEVPSTLLPDTVQLLPEAVLAVDQASFAGRTGVGTLVDCRALARFSRPPDLHLAERDETLSVPFKSLEINDV